jgi:hypothetical protein
MRLWSEAVNWRRTDNVIAKRKRTNNDVQNITQNTKDRATRTTLKTGVELVLWVEQCIQNQHKESTIYSIRNLPFTA